MLRKDLVQGSTFKYKQNAHTIYKDIGVAVLGVSRSEYQWDAQMQRWSSAIDAYGRYLHLEVELVPDPSVPVKIEPALPKPVEGPKTRKVAPGTDVGTGKAPIPGADPGGITVADIKPGQLFQVREGGAVYRLADYADSYSWPKERAVQVMLFGVAESHPALRLPKTQAARVLENIQDIQLNPRFYMVYSPVATEPPKKKMTRAQARMVARKMAEDHVGETFHVLAEIAAFRVDEVEEQVVTTVKSKKLKEV